MSLKKHITKFGLIAIILLLQFVFVNIVSNDSSDLLPKHLDLITEEQLLDDYDHFWHLLETYCPSIYSLDSDTVYLIKENGRAEVEKLTVDGQSALIKQTAVMKFISNIQQIIRDLNHVGHLAIVTKGTLDRFEVLNAEGNQNDIPNYGYLFSDNMVNETLLWLEEISNGNNSGSNEGNSSSNYEKEPVLELTHIDDNISYIRIPSFANDLKDEEGPRVAEWIENHLTDKAIIIDIRGNGGGTTRYWQDYILPYFMKEGHEVKSRFYINEWPDIPDCSKLEALIEPFIASDEEYSYVEGLPYFDLPEELCDATLYSMTTCAYDDSIPHFEGELYLLVDENTGSAAEVLMRYVKASSCGTVIGVPPEIVVGSAGVFTPLIHKLPNTGLCIECVIGYSINPDGSCGEVYSVQPDYYAESDALELCLELVEKQS